MAVPPTGIVVGAQDGDVVPRRLLPAQRQRVDFGSGLVPREKVVDGVEDPHGWISRQAQAECPRLCAGNTLPSLRLRPQTGPAIAAD